MGFRTGVYHVEARVNNSRKQYATRNGITDLEDVTGEASSTQPSAFLVEVNTRPPGEMGKVPILRAYGIDYNALHLLLAIGDTERATALSRPFVGAPQHWYEVLFITADRGGVFESDGVYKDLVKSNRELAKSVCESREYFRKGDVVPEPASDDQHWIAWFVVFSRESRRDLLEKAAKIQREVKVTFR